MMSIWIFFPEEKMSYKKISNSNELGFTLLEVIVAVGLIGLSLSIILGIVNRDIDMAAKARNAQIASNLAQNIITEIELEGYPGVGEDSGNFEEEEGFEYFVTVSPYNLSQLKTDIRIIRVLITWDEGNEDFEIWRAISQR